jgi:hypothetical protein
MHNTWIRREECAPSLKYIQAVMIMCDHVFVFLNKDVLY